MAVLAPTIKTGITEKPLSNGGKLTEYAWKANYYASIEKDSNGEVQGIKVFFSDPIKSELYPDSNQPGNYQVDIVATAENRQGKEGNLSGLAYRIENAQKSGQNPFQVLEIAADTSAPIRYFSPSLGGFQISTASGISPLTRDIAQASSEDPLSKTLHFDYYQTKAGIQKLREKLGSDLIALTIDISGMRKANEAGLGDNVDAYIAELTKHISAALNVASNGTPPQYIISRSGGDEFKIILRASDFARAENPRSQVEREVRDCLMRRHFPADDPKVVNAKNEYEKKYVTDADFMTAYVVASVFSLSANGDFDEDRMRLRSASRIGDGDLSDLKQDIKNPKNARDYLPQPLVKYIDAFPESEADRAHFASLDKFDHMREAYEEEKHSPAYSMVERAFFDHLALQAKIREPLERIRLLRLGRSSEFRPSDIFPGLRDENLYYLDIDIKNFSFFNSLLTDQLADKHIVDDIFATEISSHFDIPFVYRVSGGRFVAIAGEEFDPEILQAFESRLKFKLQELIEAQDEAEIKRVSKTTSPIGAGDVSLRAGSLGDMSANILRDIHQKINSELNH